MHRVWHCACATVAVSSRGVLSAKRYSCIAITNRAFQLRLQSSLGVGSMHRVLKVVPVPQFKICSAAELCAMQSFTGVTAITLKN